MGNEQKSGAVRPMGRMPAGGAGQGNQSTVNTQQDRIKSEWFVLGCQQGDPAAFEQLVGLWQAPLWRYVRRMTGDDSAAWDVVQETWIATAQGLLRLQDAAAFPAWLYRIASNKARDWIRRESRRRAVYEDYTRAVAAPDAAEPRTGASLAELLEGLPRDVQWILQLRYEQGFSTREIAAILFVPEGTVRSRLHHARLSLKKYLEENGDD